MAKFYYKFFPTYNKHVYQGYFRKALTANDESHTFRIFGFHRPIRCNSAMCKKGKFWILVLFGEVRGMKGEAASNRATNTVLNLTHATRYFVFSFWKYIHWNGLAKERCMAQFVWYQNATSPLQLIGSDVTWFVMHKVTWAVGRESKWEANTKKHCVYNNCLKGGSLLWPLRYLMLNFV